MQLDTEEVNGLESLTLSNKSVCAHPINPYLHVLTALLYTHFYSYACHTAAVVICTCAAHQEIQQCLSTFSSVAFTAASLNACHLLSSKRSILPCIP